MFTQRILAGFILAGLAGAVIASDANAQSNRVLTCQQECAGNPACLRTCGSVEKRRTAVRPPRHEEPPPPTLKSWQDDVFDNGKGGGGGGSGGGGR